VDFGHVWHIFLDLRRSLSGLQGLPGGAEQELGRSDACGVLRRALYGGDDRDDPWGPGIFVWLRDISDMPLIIPKNDGELTQRTGKSTLF